MYRTHDSLIIGIAFINSATAVIVILSFSTGFLSSLQFVFEIAGLLFAALSLLSLVLCLKLLLHMRTLSGGKGEDAPGMLRDLHYPQTPDDSKYYNLYIRADSLVSERLLYLEQKYTIMDLAQTLGTNRTDLSTAFKKNTPGGFCRYINMYRVEYAISLMKENPDLMVEEISSRSGFSSPNTFGTWFKEYTNGVTPRDFLTDLRASRSRLTARQERPGPEDRPEDRPGGRPVHRPLRS